jgi:tetratricopeptide (TPR) repeat protein
VRQFGLLVGLLVRVLVAALCVGLASEPRSLAAPEAVLRGDRALAEGRQIAQADAAYQAALEVQPGDYLILSRLIDMLLKANRPDQAAMLLGQQAGLHGWSADMRRKMADVLIAQGEREQAALFWQASLSGSRDDIATLRKLVDYYLNNRDWTATIESLSRLIAIDPADERSLYQLGLLIAPTDAATALTYLDRAAADPQYRAAAPAIRAAIIAHSTESPAALAFQVGLALMSLQVWPYAEHALTLAVEKDASNAVALAFLGVAQDQQSRDGWPMIDKAFIAAPGDPMVNYAVALHWRLAGNAQKALAALVRAQALDPRNPAIAAEIGLVYQMEGRFDEAALWLNVAVTLAPNHAGFRTLLATFYADTHYNLADEGLNAIRRLAQLSPDDADVHASLGWALFSTGQVDAARVELEKALVLDPTNVRARYYFGIFLENRGDHEGAVDAYLYVYRSANTSFHDLAAGALRRLGYQVEKTG